MSTTPVVLSDKQLGTFAGGALIFVRELLQGEEIAYREEPHGGNDFEPSSDIWVAATAHDRALALLAAAQLEAEEAACRESAQLADEAARAAAEAARTAAQAARVAAIQAEHAARRAAREARRRERQERRRRRAPAESDEVNGSAAALRVVGSALVAFLLVVVVVVLIGERWGTHPPTPGRYGKEIVCSRYGVCTTR